MPSPSVNSIDLPVEIFGGKVSLFDPQKLPQGGSPFNQDVIFSGLDPSGVALVAGVATRPGMQSIQPPFAGAPSVNYIKTFVDLLGNERQLELDGLGNLYQDYPAGTLAVIGGVVPGSFAQSATLDGKEWLVFGNQQFGIDIPRQWDGTNFDRISSVGPGIAPTVVDGAAGNISAGNHQVSVCFVYRSGYITCPAPPTTWAAGGSKKANLTNIAVGPPQVVARIVIFTPVITSPATTGPFFYFEGPVATPSAGTFPSMVIQDNVTTTATFDFLDAVLQNGTGATLFFNRIELGECSSVIAYSDRLFFGGERNKVNAAGGGGGFNNLTFDGGFGTAGGAPTQANSGPNSGTAAANQPFPPGAVAWTNPAGIDGNNPGTPATAPFIPAGGGQSQTLVATGFGFAIPANATIVGVIVTVDAKGSRNLVLTDNGVFLVKANVLAGADHSNGNLLTNAFGTQTYGSSSDTWSTSLAPADVNAAGFGAAYEMTNNDNASARTGSATNMTIKIFYTTPATGGTVGPWGWTQGASYAGGSSALTSMQKAYWGDAFAITGDGATAVRGLITQPANQDYLGVSLIVVNQSYRVRARCASAGGLTQGTLHVNLQSTIGGYTTPGLAVQSTKLTGSYVEFDGLLTAALTSIPTDLVLQVYADGTPSNGGVFLIDCIEIYPANQPVNRTILRASYALDPEAIDVETGFMIVGNDNGQAITALSQMLDNKMYVTKERSEYVTNDDGANEPSSWTISTVSQTVGTPSVYGVAAGESWRVCAAHDGFYIFNGAEWVKISQEIQPDWDAINWNFGKTIYTVVDTARKRIHCGVPTGANTKPNAELVLDFAQLGSVQDIIDHPQAYYSLYQPTKVIAPGRARKWTAWNLFAGAGANCAALTLRADGSYHLLRGNAAGTGKIYDQVTGQLSDDGIAINSINQTYFMPEAEQEEQLQLGSHRKLYKYLTGYASGVGFLFMTITGPNGQRTKSLTTIILQNPPQWDFEMNVNWTGERASFICGTDAVGSWFHLTKLTPNLQRELLTYVRGTA